MRKALFQAVNQSWIRVSLVQHPHVLVILNKTRAVDRAPVRQHSSFSQQCLCGVSTSRLLSCHATLGNEAEAANTWRSNWSTFLHVLHAKGFFSADPHLNVDDVHSGNQPAIKRAILNFSRQHPNILSHLNNSVVTKLVKAGAAHADADRKTRNAYKRLEASFLRGQSLPESDGGAGDLQDLLRLVFALELASANNSMYNSGGLADAADEFLNDLLKIVGREIGG